MKTIKLNKNLNLNINYNEEGNIEVQVIDKEHNKVSNTNITITKCPICQSLHIGKEDSLCETCQEYMNAWTGNMQELNKMEIKPELPKGKKERKVKVVMNYGKSRFADKNIKIDNLVELHNMVVDIYSPAKLDTLLKFAIMGESYEAIAKKLNVLETSIRRDYGILAKRGLALINQGKPQVPSIVKYHTVSTPLDNYPAHIQKHYNYLLPAFKDWNTSRQGASQLKNKIFNIKAYIKALSKYDLVERSGCRKEMNYRLKYLGV